MLNELNVASKAVGLNMNLSKTKVIGVDGQVISVDGVTIENVSQYIYLGHNIRMGRDNQTTELKRRIRLTWAAFSKLVTSSKTKIPINLKMKVYEACVLPVAMYGIETLILT